MESHQQSALVMMYLPYVQTGQSKKYSVLLFDEVLYRILNLHHWDEPLFYSQVEEMN